MENFSALLQSSKEWICDAFFPPKCLCCGKEGSFLCPRHEVFLPAPENRVRFEHIDHIFSAVAYDEPITQKAIEMFKYRGNKDLADIFSRTIGEKLPTEFIEESILVPIPLHWTREVWRGFNQSSLLAKGIQKHFQSQKKEIRVIPLLQRIIRTQQQARLSKIERQKNISAAFKIRSEFQGKKFPKVILIDDVVASGSTLEQAAKVLKESGIQTVLAITFARGGKSSAKKLLV